MIPLRDDNPVFSVPRITIGLMVINVIVFLIEVMQGGGGMNAFIYKWGFIPAELVQGRAEFRQRLEEETPVQQAVDRFGRPVLVRVVPPVEAATAHSPLINLFTSMFLHGGWMHLLGNMLYLWIFGRYVEDALGGVLFVVVYLATGVLGNLAHAVHQPTAVPLVGASGAISGIMGAYILLAPRAKILAVVPAGWYWFTVKLPAWIFLAFYVVIQNLYPAYFGREGGVAYLAHIGGFVSGLIILYLLPLRRRAARARPVRPISDEDADLII